MARSNPEVVISGTRGSIERFFQPMGVVAILIVEVHYKVGNYAERLSAVSRAIAECDGKPQPSYFYFFTLNSLEQAGTP